MVGGSAGGPPDEGTGDWGGWTESKSIFFGPYYNRQLVRVPACPFWPLLWAYSAENLVKTHPSGAELTLGLQEVSYYCGERRRLMAATLTAFYTKQMVLSKEQAIPALYSRPLLHNGGRGQKQVSININKNRRPMAKVERPCDSQCSGTKKSFTGRGQLVVLAHGGLPIPSASIYVVDDIRTTGGVIII